MCRLGRIISAKKHFKLAGQQTDLADLYRMEKIEKHVAKCFEARKNGDWDTVVMESDAAVVAGADSASQVGRLLLLLSPFCLPSWRHVSNVMMKPLRVLH